MVSDMKIELYLEGRIKLSSEMLTEDDQRYLIAYLWKQKPSMVQEIVCEECPEVVRSVW
jgi:hypothetical protein